MDATADSSVADNDATRDASSDGPTDASGCTPESSQACYSGPAGTENVGICRAGSRRCEAGQWGACTGQVLPREETCNDEDDDCNGETDDLLFRPCYSGPAGTVNVGLCREGAEACNGGEWGACSNEVLPQTERCNTDDDDCDGQTDEGCDCATGKTQPCGSDVGECSKGSQLCDASGQWGLCSGQVGPVAELCDNKDNDCDTEVDEVLARQCYIGPAGTAGVGLCHAGTELCSAGSWSPCAGQVLPVEEVCDGLDNDCDGETDEELIRSCYSGPPGTEGEGVCEAGIQTCTNGQWSTTCEGEVLPTDEECNYIDDDCDGQRDHLTRSCYTASTGCSGKPGGAYTCAGLCQPGEQSCHLGFWAPACFGQVVPAVEVCDDEDNDCNGETDEGEVTCGVGACEVTIPMCVDGVDNPDTCTPGTPGAEELCGDNVDNDCDGLVDQRRCFTGATGCNLSGATYACEGLCKSGIESCDDDGWSGVCEGEVVPVPEICDGEDNDCNGMTDVRVCYTGATGCVATTDGFDCEGLCNPGLDTCLIDDWSGCFGETVPIPEVCANGADDDCDGDTDEPDCS